MPMWLIVLFVAVLALPGVVVVMAGVTAMFFAPRDYDRRRKWLDEGRCAFCGADREGSGVNCSACGRGAELPPIP